MHDKKTANLLKVELGFRPKPYEIDLTGIVSNTVIVKWMEDLRVEMMDVYFSDLNFEERNNLSVIYKTEINYRKPVSYSDKISGYAWVKEFAHSKWVVEFQFLQEDSGQIHVNALQWGAFIDPRSGMPVRMPESFKSTIKKYQKYQ